VAREAKRSLDPYAAKRSFTRTPEPAPARAPARSGPLLFVVQKHAARRLHYDFRLELDGVLKSWAVPKGPSLQPSEKRMAVEVEDHPFDYASFEGTIPAREYGAGNVIVWDCGVYSPDEDARYAFDDRAGAESRVREELARGKLSLFLRGEKLKGSFTLVRTKAEKQWLLIKHQDRFAGRDDVLAQAKSVLSGATLDTVGAAGQPERLPAARLTVNGPRERLPAELDPMLAESDGVPRTSRDWLYEPKLDGYRVVAFVEGSKVRLQSRRGLDLTAMFPEVVGELAAQAVGTLILDGEIVALDAAGRPSFNALQKRAQLKTPGEIAAARNATPVVFVCFDLLHFAGVNVRRAAFADRRRYLAQCLLPGRHVQLIHNATDGSELYAAALASGFEGIVAKRRDSTYEPGRRSPSWRKIKAAHTAEFVIGGYTRGKGAREPLGALLLGYFEKRSLRYAGHVGSGLTDQVIAELRADLERLARNSSPFVEKPPLHRPTSWLEPQLVAEVEYSEFTAEGLLRAPVFLRLRADVPARSIQGRPDGARRDAATGRTRRSQGARASVDPPASSEVIAAVLEQLRSSASRIDLAVGDARIRLTNLERVYWPADKRAGHRAFTKRDLIAYLAAVSPYMLPHLADRPLTMIRMPEGISGERFFQKHWEQSLPEFVETVTVFSEHRDTRHAYLLANNLPTLLWLGQNGTLEFHVWHSRLTRGEDAAVSSTDFSSSLEALENSVLNYPDYLVFDIDPYIYSGKEAQGAEPELNAKGFATGKRVAFWLRALLREMSLEAIVKTSGKTGLHIFVPIARTVTFDAARHICESIGRHLMKEHPREITMDWAIPKRTGKIFIDYNMNVRGKTLNVAYSPRGVPGAPVSMPLAWEELEAADPTDFTLGNALTRLEKTGDRWHDALSAKQSLAQAFGAGTKN